MLRKKFSVSVVSECRPSFSHVKSRREKRAQLIPIPPVIMAAQGDTIPADASATAGEGAADPAKSAQDLTVFVQNLLQQMQGRFQQMSEAIIGRIDEMGTRIDDLEKSIGDLMVQAGEEEEQVAAILADTQGGEEGAGKALADA